MKYNLTYAHSRTSAIIMSPCCVGTLKKLSTTYHYYYYECVYLYSANVILHLMDKTSSQIECNKYINTTYKH